MQETKNDIAWERLFEKYHILDRLKKKERVSISSTQINEFREARLMTKFDHRSQLPKLFTEHKLSILPTSRGTYEIGEFETFYDFDKEDVDTIHVNYPRCLESIDYKDIRSESIAINCAFVSEILHLFAGEEKLFPTISGRMGSSLFDFTIKSEKRSYTITIENSQIEIDAGFEGKKSLILIEAKNYISDDFIIRQLYYPYRLWSNKISKPVRPIFLTYSNGIFDLREYRFVIPTSYNSIQLIQRKKYSIRENSISIGEIQKILNSVQVDREPMVPFPQANSFERVINLCELLKHKGFITKDDITSNYDFDQRQTDYYSNAAIYLGLIEKKEKQQSSYALTQAGSRTFDLPIAERQLEFVRLILSRAAFKNTLTLYFQKGNTPTRDEIIAIMKNAHLHNINSEETYRRRASTIISWINWILALPK